MSGKRILPADGLGSLFAALEARGFTVVGPTVREGAIVYDRLASPDDLPRGVTDEQDGGVYRLKARQDDALFGYVVGPQSWKRFLDPPVKRLWRAERDADGFKVIPEEPASERFAFLGVRSCEIHAMAIQDRVFAGGQYRDPGYAARRGSAFIIAVQCTQAGGTCFCVSMNTGPEARSGYDIALTEVIDSARHFFVAEAGSPGGREVLEALDTRPAEEGETTEAAKRIAAAAGQMGRTLDTTGVRDLLTQNPEHARWAEVAGRCLSCANCTMVCPTCFCSTVEDVTDVSGDHAERWQKQDSCFTVDFSYLHGGSVRASTRSRYRQWLTHKLATWIDQFGVSGCTGCGRCITWCPVAIDLTEEVAAIRANPAAPGSTEKGQT